MYVQTLLHINFVSAQQAAKLMIQKYNNNSIVHYTKQNVISTTARTQRFVVDSIVVRISVSFDIK